MSEIQCAKCGGRHPKGKRHAGSNKGRAKKRAYQIHVQSQIRAGLVSMPGGQWASPAGLDPKVRNRAETQAQRMGGK